MQSKFFSQKSYSRRFFNDIIIKIINVIFFFNEKENLSNNKEIKHMFNPFRNELIILIYIIFYYVIEKHQHDDNKIIIKFKNIRVKSECDLNIYIYIN